MTLPALRLLRASKGGYRLSLTAGGRTLAPHRSALDEGLESGAAGTSRAEPIAHVKGVRHRANARGLGERDRC